MNDDRYVKKIIGSISSAKQRKPIWVKITLINFQVLCTLCYVNLTVSDKSIIFDR